MVFQCGCIVLYSHQQRIRIPIVPYHCQPLVLFFFFFMSLNFIFKSLRPKYKLLWNNCGVLFSGLQSEHILLHYCYFFTQCFWFLSTFIWENLNYICIHTHTHTHTHTNNLQEHTKYCFVMTAEQTLQLLTLFYTEYKIP